MNNNIKFTWLFFAFLSPDRCRVEFLCTHHLMCNDACLLASCFHKYINFINSFSLSLLLAAAVISSNSFQLFCRSLGLLILFFCAYSIFLSLTALFSALLCALHILWFFNKDQRKNIMFQRCELDGILLLFTSLLSHFIFFLEMLCLIIISDLIVNETRQSN